MKKTAIIVISLILVSLLAFSVNAAAAFAQLPVEDAVMVDDDTTQDKGGSGQPIQIVDGYGCGYSSQNDIVKYEDVDFGANGAKSMTIFFSYGNNDDSVTTLEVYIDSDSGKPVCSYEIGFTGGWEATYAKEFTADCSIPAGTHDVLVKFTNEKSGSFTWVSFVEADPVIVVEETPEEVAPVEAAPAAAEAAPVTTAAQTFDVVVLAIAAAAVSAGAAIVSKKRR